MPIDYSFKDFPYLWVLEEIYRRPLLKAGVFPIDIRKGITQAEVNVFIEKMEEIPHLRLKQIVVFKILDELYSNPLLCMHLFWPSFYRIERHFQVQRVITPQKRQFYDRATETYMCQLLEANILDNKIEDNKKFSRAVVDLFTACPTWLETTTHRTYKIYGSIIELLQLSGEDEIIRALVEGINDPIVKALFYNKRGNTAFRSLG